ncbi:putative quinol monooxygenase [Saccharopolyspora hattusasensis]|uniref:putative quinol monooxygenase n=1 Tax=Saccharopolyspora hattusasensis TaxID=1128679 RepID=UPI003D96F820
MSIPVVARYRAAPGRLPEVLELLAAVAPLNRAEDGCQRFDVFHDETDPDVIVILEQWATDDHIAAHHASRHFQDLVLGRLVPILDSREITRLKVVSE